VTHPDVHGKATLKDGILTITVTRATGKEVVTTYRVERLQADPEIATPPTWRLVKIVDGNDSEKYDIRLDPAGYLVCDCPDYLQRDRLCKHCRAANAVGLFPQLTPERIEG
jgi:hypothetical protein